MGKFNEISISSCDLSEEKCSIVRGSETHVSLKFTPSKSNNSFLIIRIQFLILIVSFPGLDISNVKARAYGVLLDVPVEFPMEKPDVCEDPDSGLKCPLTKDQESEYKASFTVDKKIPAVIALENLNFYIFNLTISFYIIYLYIIILFSVEPRCHVGIRERE